jgi:CMP/dCMP kinase
LGVIYGRFSRWEGFIRWIIGMTILDSIITIDGPAGAGKSTICKLLAARLGMECLDTGAMYRAVAWFLRKHKKEDLSGENLAFFLKNLDFRIEGQGLEQKVWVDGEDVGPDIRTPEISWLASVVSKKPEVRALLTERQRALGRHGKLVAEGRDMGTVIFPQAEYKFYLSASVLIRARRRNEELIGRGQAIALEKVIQEMEERDLQDQNRDLAPLCPAPGALIIDTSDLSVEQVLEKMISFIEERRPEKGFD